MPETDVRVLVVDDDRVNRMMLSRLVEREGHHVVIAEDGNLALEALESGQFDIVLLDIVMPNLDGVGVLEQMQSSGRLKETPVIMISAVDDIKSVVRCIELGAEDYLPKPFNPILLRARINSVLSRRRLRELERARVRDMFSRFVPESVVDELLEASDGHLRLGGERCIATVMFCDLRGFTKFAESQSPAAVIDVLNRYLSTMSDVILDHGGTLVSYLGDGVMAVFGAPIEAPDHADRALNAARHMTGPALSSFNDWLERENFGTRFRMGVGLNSGPVMSGNVGSERRVEYAAVGDTTNTAARIEKVTKSSQYMVLMSSATQSMLTRNVPDLVEVDMVKVPGKQSEIGVWSVESSGRPVFAQ